MPTRGKQGRGSAGDQSPSPMTKDVSSTCKSCSILCSEDDQLISCYQCRSMYHVKCLNISKSSMNFYTSNNLAKEGFLWICQTCRSGGEITSSILSKVSDLKQNMAELKTSLLQRLEVVENKLVAEVGTQENKIKEKLHTYAEIVSHNAAETTESVKVISSIHNNMKNFQTNVEKRIDEENENKMRKQKESNVCLFNLPESSSDDEKTKYNHDISNLKKILPGSVKAADLKAVYRIGKSGSSPRPIVIKFTNMERRSEVLKLRNLSFKSVNSEEVKIYIAPDRTKQQQQEHKRLVSELKLLKAQGQSDLMIKNGKIINRSPSFLSNPQLFWGH